MKGSLGIFKRKLSLIRFRFLRQAACFRYFLNPVRDRVYLWPPFAEEDREHLRSVQDESFHYLHNLDTRLCYFVRDEYGLSRKLMSLADGQILEEVRTSDDAASTELKRARYQAHWRYDARPWASSLRSEVYIVTNTETGHLGSRDWLRLTYDIYTAQHKIPERTRSFPPFVQTCAILGSGPSLDRYIDESDLWDGWIGTNFVVCDERIRGIGRPLAYCIADPECFAPMEEFTLLRERLFELLRNTNAVLYTFASFAPFIELNFPEEIKAKCHYVKCLGLDTYRFNTHFRVDDLLVTGYGNVLTDLMLPLATCLSRKIVLYGCDGMPPGADRFPKNSELDRFDQEYIEANPKSLIGLSKYVEEFSRNTGYVVRECIAHGAEIFLRSPSWNTGLSGLPVLADIAKARDGSVCGGEHAAPTSRMCV